MCRYLNTKLVTAENKIPKYKVNGGIFMCKKFISLGMSFLILFKISTSTVFALNNEKTYQNIDYCRGYPKNIYGNTVNVDCAISNVVPEFKRNKEKTSISLKNLGRKDQL